MAFLVDTSILARIANPSDASHKLAMRAVILLHRQGEDLRIAPQHLIEFRNVSTRSVSVNGLGLSTADAEKQMAAFESVFPLLPETSDIYPAWKSLVHAAGVIGKQVHDARLVAICQVHSVSHILTFNVQHFI